MESYERYDLSQEEGFKYEKEEEVKIDKVESRRNKDELGVKVHIPIEESKLWDKGIWRKYDRKLKHEYSKQGKKVSVFVETVLEDTEIGFNRLNNYLVVKSGDTEVGREVI